MQADLSCTLAGFCLDDFHALQSTTAVCFVMLLEQANNAQAKTQVATG